MKEGLPEWKDTRSRWRGHRGQAGQGPSGDSTGLGKAAERKKGLWPALPGTSHHLGGEAGTLAENCVERNPPFPRRPTQQRGQLAEVNIFLMGMPDEAFSSAALRFYFGFF